MTQLISGHTRIIAHLGVPTESFRAPMIYNPYFEAEGIDVVVVPMGVEPADFPDFLRLLFRLRNIAGALVTMPHKVTAAGLVDVASAAVGVCGACNAVRRGDDGRLEGDMFDGEGFVIGMERKGRIAKGASALVLGSGGVGSAIAASLARAGAARIAVSDTRPEAAGALAASLSRHYPGLQVETGRDPAGFDIVVNATPVGMNADDPLPMDPGLLAPGTFVGDVVMKQEETPFLAAARARGCTVQIGSDMLYEQIPAYLDFFGIPGTTADRLRELSRLRY
ncbi:shikimate dehydrogenase [Rhodobacterales bacterium HKCCE2091]|nr:shikimate dehydrogenase [Rhodobacterales bacterium HKCCE2091]